MQEVNPVYAKERAIKRLKLNSQTVIDRHVNLGSTPIVAVLVKQLNLNYQYETFTVLKMLLHDREKQFFDDGLGTVTVVKTSDGFKVSGSTFHVRDVLYRNHFCWNMDEKCWFRNGHNSDFFASVIVVAKRFKIKVTSANTSVVVSWLLLYVSYAYLVFLLV